LNDYLEPTDKHSTWMVLQIHTTDPLLSLTEHRNSYLYCHSILTVSSQTIPFR
jgi:hypothetical protein